METTISVYGTDYKQCRMHEERWTRLQAGVRNWELLSISDRIDCQEKQGRIVRKHLCGEGILYVRVPTILFHIKICFCNARGVARSGERTQKNVSFLRGKQRYVTRGLLNVNRILRITWWLHYAGGLSVEPYSVRVSQHILQFIVFHLSWFLKMFTQNDQN